MGAYLLSCPYPKLTRFTKMGSLKMLGKFSWIMQNTLRVLLVPHIKTLKDNDCGA